METEPVLKITSLTLAFQQGSHFILRAGLSVTTAINKKLWRVGCCCCSLWAAVGLPAAWTASAEPTWLLRPSAGSGCSSRWSPAGSSGAEVGGGICSCHGCSVPAEERGSAENVADYTTNCVMWRKEAILKDKPCQAVQEFAHLEQSEDSMVREAMWEIYWFNLTMSQRPNWHYFVCFCKFAAVKLQDPHIWIELVSIKVLQFAKFITWSF